MGFDEAYEHRKRVKFPEKSSADSGGFNPIHRDFCDRVGAEGFPELNRHGFFGRSVWFLVICAAWCVSLVQCFQFIVIYLGHPYETVIDLRSSAILEFPAVTICNLNPMRREALRQDIFSEKLSFLDGGVDDSKAQKFMSVMERPSFDLTGDDSTEVTNEAMLSTMMRSDDNMEMMQKMGMENLATTVFYEAYMQLNESLRREIGHSPKETVLACYWGGQQCRQRQTGNDEEDDTVLAMRSWVHQLYGNCITYNYDGKSRVYLSGKGNGLQLLLDAQAYHYIPLVARSVGMRVSVHNHSSAPFPEDYGHTLAAGFTTELELRQVLIQRIDKPWTEYGCRDTWPEEMEARMQHYWENGTFTSQGCRKMCLQGEIMRECGCVYYKYPEFGLRKSMKNGDDLKPCSLKSIENTKCIKAVSVATLNSSCGTQCFAEACTETDYQVRGNLILWPNDQYAAVLYQDFVRRAEKSGSGDEKAYWGVGDANASITEDGIVDKVRKTAIELNIYYERLSYQTIEQRSTYDIVSLLGDFGGAVGLWAGVSMLSFCQISEYVLELLVYFCSRKYLVDVSKAE